MRWLSGWWQAVAGARRSILEHRERDAFLERIRELEDSRRLLESRLAILETEKQLLQEVVERDRERVAAETAIHSRRIVEATEAPVR